jgi:hypothetical protein
MKKAIALIAVLAYAIAFAACVLNPELLDIPLLFLSGCFVTILVLVSTNKKKAKK